MTAKMRCTGGEKIFYLVVAVLLAAAFYALPPLGLYSNEEGVRYVQMKNFALHGSRSIPYHGKDVGFGPEVLTRSGGYFILREGRLETICAPLFPLLASFFYPALGDRAIHLLPLLFYFLGLAVLGRTLALIMERGSLYYFLLVVYLCGSPVFLFLFGFAENTAVVFLATVALYFLVRHYKVSPSAANYFCASFAMGGAVFFSPISLFFFVSFLASVSIVACRDHQWSELVASFSGGLSVLAVLVLSDSILYGQFPGAYLADFLRHHSISETRLTLLGAIISLGALIPFIARKAELSIPWESGANAVVVILLVLGVLGTSAYHSFVLFILAFPAVLFTFYGIPGGVGETERKGPLEIILMATVFLSLVFASSLAQPSESSTLDACLPAVPATILLIALSRERMFEHPGMYGLLVFAAAFAFVLGYGEAKGEYWLHSSRNAEWVEFLKENTAAGDIIIFDNRGSMEHAGPLFFDRVFLVARAGAVDTLLDRLKESGVKQCHLWTRDTRLKFELGNAYDDRKEVVSGSISACGSCTGSCAGGFKLVHVDLEKEQAREGEQDGYRAGGREKGLRNGGVTG